MRNLMATLLLSQGIPMLVAGDERSRTQRGNNNAYCQNSEIGWLDWSELGEKERSFFEFVRRCLQLRRAHIAFHRHRFFLGVRGEPGESKDIAWLRPDGAEMGEPDWHGGGNHHLACVISGEAHGYHLTVTGDPESDDDFLLVLHAGTRPLVQTLPSPPRGGSWEALLDTTRADAPEAARYEAGSAYELAPRSIVLLVGRGAAPSERAGG
jgi:isoamylase